MWCPALTPGPQVKSIITTHWNPLPQAPRHIHNWHDFWSFRKEAEKHLLLRFTLKGCFTLYGMCIVYACMHKCMQVQVLIVCRSASMHAVAWVCYTQVSVPFVCRYACLLHVCMPIECGRRFLLNAGVSTHSFTEAREQDQVSSLYCLRQVPNWTRSSLFQLHWLATKYLGSTCLHSVDELVFYQFNAS